jgi:hypothetical protein
VDTGVCGDAKEPGTQGTLRSLGTLVNTGGCRDAKEPEDSGDAKEPGDSGDVKEPRDPGGHVGLWGH